MKTARRVLLAGLFLGAIAFGQRGGGMGEGGEGMGMGGGGGSRGGGGGGYIPSAGPSRKSRMESLSEMLSLNKEQKKEVKAAMDDGQKEATPLREQMLKVREQLAEVIAAGKGQDEINAAVKSCAALQSEMAVVELKTFARIYSVLDREQKAKTGPVFQMMTGAFLTKNWNES